MESFTIDIPEAVLEDLHRRLDRHALDGGFRQSSSTTATIYDAVTKSQC